MTILQEIEKAIDESARKTFKDEGYTNTISNFARHDQEVFKAGAAFVLPLLRKVIEQRDCRIEAEYGVLYSEKDNKELLDLLEGK